MLLRSIHNKKKVRLNKEILRLNKDDILIVKYPLEWIEKYDYIELFDLFNDMSIGFGNITNNFIFIPTDIKLNVINKNI